MRKVFLLLVSLFVVSCATVFSITGEKISRLSPGMTKAEVIQTLGNPDGFKKIDGQEILTYSHRLVTVWAWDRADYHVILKDGKVTEYGAGEIRVKEDMRTILLIPIK